MLLTFGLLAFEVNIDCDLRLPLLELLLFSSEVLVLGITGVSVRS